MELDHIFIFVQPSAPEANALTQFGFTEGRRRAHPGQGTTNVCFFFQNAFLELLWTINEDEVRSPVIQPTGLWERSRWHSTNACPFGIAFRSSSTAPLPFDIWNYQPPYMPAGRAIPIATNSPIQQEPLLFISPARIPPSATPPETRPVLEHPCGVQTITAVTVTLPIAAASPELSAVQNLGLVQWVRERIEITSHF
jgi:hypothetical protein